MENTTTSPAPRKFCVYADCTTRIYQEITASTPEEAYRLAKDDKYAWQHFEHEDDGYWISNEVQDIATGEFIAVGKETPCKTCDSEIVETINESNFREGECGPCEYARYRNQIR